MTSWVYLATGVSRPMITARSLSRNQAMWDSAVVFAEVATTQIDTAITALQNDNQGPATDSAIAALRGPDSARHAYQLIASAARSYADAHGRAALVLTQCLTEMDAVAKQTVDDLDAIAALDLGASLLAVALPQHRLSLAKATLQHLEQAAADELRQVYDFAVPTPPGTPDKLPTYADPEYGSVDPRIAALWDALEPAEQQAVLRAIVAEQLAAHGIDPANVPVSFPTYADRGDLQGQAGGDLWWGLVPSGQSIEFNSINIDQPGILNTAAHEVQHVVQDYALAEYNRTGPETLRQIEAGLIPDPFIKYGMSLAQVRALTMGSYESATSTADPNYPYYLAQPAESDARQAGRDLGTGMSYERLLDLMVASGVPIPDH